MLQELKQQIAETIRLYNSKGWSPATSTNYSFKDDQNAIWVSRSGIDKSQFSENDFMVVDEFGNPSKEFSDLRPSAETLIHCVLYQLFPETKVILHSHSVFPVVLSEIQKTGNVSFHGYEVQKGFAGQPGHEAQLLIPVFDNTQDMISFSETLKRNAGRITNHSFIMKKHGTYAWGKNLFEAKRHLETLEYLCECEYRLHCIK
jgi:methylthioribulose-1-phosphate dehydratase